MAWDNAGMEAIVPMARIKIVSNLSYQNNALVTKLVPNILITKMIPWLPIWYVNNVYTDMVYTSTVSKMIL